MELYLTYIYRVGTDWKGDNVYDFIFSDTTENIDGENWDGVPASVSNPKPPNDNFVIQTGRLTCGMTLDLIQDSTEFCVWDGVDGLIALGWENIEECEQYPEKRLYFPFADKKKSVTDKLYEYDLVLEYNNDLEKKFTDED